MQIDIYNMLINKICQGMQISVCELNLFHVLRHGDVNSSKRSDLLDHVIQVQSCFGTMILPLFLLFESSVLSRCRFEFFAR